MTMFIKYFRNVVKSRHFFIRNFNKNNFKHCSADSIAPNLRIWRKYTHQSQFKHVSLKTGKKKDEVNIRVINSGASGSSKSVILNCNSLSYLFNCGENVSRIGLGCIDRGIVRNVCNVFITHKSWENLGGVTGLALTMEMKGIPRIVIHGPTGVDSIVKSSILYSEESRIEVGYTQPWDSEFKDDNIHIVYAPLLPEDVEKFHNPPEGSVTEKTKKLSVFTPLTHPKCVYSYIVKVPPDKVLEGKVSKPKNILLIECPYGDYLYSVLNSKQLKELQNDDEMAADLVIHLSSYDIIQTSQYQQFIKRFPDSTYHLYLHEKTSGVHSQSFIQFHAELNMLHPEMFPLVHMPRQQIPDPEDEKHILAKPYLKYVVRPANDEGFSWESCVKEGFHEKSLEKRTMNKELLKICNEFKENVLSKRKAKEGPKYPEVVFLGTASCQPSVYRTVSSYLVHLDANTSLIMDCGEGTVSQLEYLYGDETDEVLSKVKVLYLSHLHDDHHFGMSGLLMRRKEALKRLGKDYKPLLIIAPVQYADFLMKNEEHFKVRKIKELLRMIPTQYLMKAPYLLEENIEHYPEIADLAVNSLNCKEVLVVPVLHNKHATGLILTHKSGYKIVYSGDTMPCPALVDTGKDCDLLIHEATLSSNLADRAKRGRHSTFDEAVKVGQQMRAKFIMLTHFSQRYEKFPVFDHRQYNEKIGFAFDLMKVKLSDAEVMSELLDSCKQIFKRAVEASQRKELRIIAKSKDKNLITNFNIGNKKLLMNISKRDKENSSLVNSSINKKVMKELKKRKKTS